MSGYHIGDVRVCMGEPPNGNPYLDKNGPQMNDRAEALRKFMRGIPQPEFTFWHAPCCGGAKRITRDEVNWESSGVSKGDWGESKDGRVRCRKCNKEVWASDRRRCKCDEISPLDFDTQTVMYGHERIQSCR